MTLNFSPTCNIQELLYDNRRLSEIVMELKNKIISLQSELDKCHELIELLSKENEETKQELKSEKSKIMEQLNKISENYKKYSESHQKLFIVEKEYSSLHTDRILQNKKISILSNLVMYIFILYIVQ